MGLDQYAYHRKRTEGEEEQLAYWRKHSKLHQFMQDLWVHKTGESSEEFNLQPLELEKQDILSLLQAVANVELPESEGGFFFGHQWQDARADMYREDDLKFIAEALKLIDEGEVITYMCWW